MRLTKRRIVLSALAAIACLILASAALGYIRVTRFNENYNNLQTGDSKQLVVDQLGQPKEIRPCRPAEGAVTSLKDPCHEEYWYFSFMERWIVYLDNDGRVIDKSYAVSY